MRAWTSAGTGAVDRRTQGIFEGKNSWFPRPIGSESQKDQHKRNDRGRRWGCLSHVVTWPALTDVGLGGGSDPSRPPCTWFLVLLTCGTGPAGRQLGPFAETWDRVYKMDA